MCGIIFDDNISYTLLYTQFFGVGITIIPPFMLKMSFFIFLYCTVPNVLIDIIFLVGIFGLGDV